MAQSIGEVSLTAAARRLGIHYNTALTWANEALTGGRSRFARGTVRRDLTRRLWVAENEVRRLEAENLEEALRM